MKVEQKREKAGLKLNILKTKIMASGIMASGPITSWEIYGETVEAVSDFYFTPDLIIIVINAEKTSLTILTAGLGVLEDILSNI